MVQTKVRKAVIAAAGFVTRFLPQTKAMPKEMLPLVDKPIIQYVVEELVAAGIKDIIIVTGYSKRSIEDHFDAPNQDLIANLKQGGREKEPLLKEIDNVANLANFAYIRQKGPYGSATPVMNAMHLIGDEPFIYCYADDFTIAHPNSYLQMIKLYQELDGIILPCIEATKDEDYDQYGILGGQIIREGVLETTSITEKPGKKKASSNFASVGGYLLTPAVFDYINDAKHTLRADQEFFMTDFVLQPMAAKGEQLYGCLIKNSRRYDTGNKLDYLKTVVEFALKHKDIAEDFRDYLRGLDI